MVPWSMCPLIQGCELVIQKCHHSPSRAWKPINRLQKHMQFICFQGPGFHGPMVPWAMCPLTKGCGLGIQKCHHSSSRTQIPRNRLQGRLWVFQWSHGAMGPMVPWSMCPLIQGCELYVQQCHQSSSRTPKPKNQL